MTVRNCIGWARLDTIAAKNTTRVINVVDTSIAFPGGNPLRIGVLRGLDVNTSRRAGGGAEETADTFFQSILIPVQNMDSTVTGLEMNGFFGVILRDGFPKHIAERDAKALYQRDKRFACFPDDGRHQTSV